MKEEAIDREPCESKGELCDQKLPKPEKPKTKNEIRSSPCRKYGKQKQTLKPLKPKVLGAEVPTDIKKTLLKIVGEFRRVQKNFRIGREIRHVLSLKTDEEIIEKILSLSDAEMLKDLHHSLNGGKEKWNEFVSKYSDVKESNRIGVYMIAFGWTEDTRKFLNIKKFADVVHSIYVGSTEAGFMKRHRYHKSFPGNLDEQTVVPFLKDVLGFNRNQNKYHYIALLQTSHNDMKKDKFCESLQEDLDMDKINKKRKRHKKEAQEEAITYFFKTAEAIFIALYFSCQSHEWYNVSMRKCQPGYDPPIGVNMCPALDIGEIGHSSNYTQDPRIEEIQELFNSKTFKEILKIVADGIKELKRRSITKKNPCREKTKILGKQLSTL